MDQKIGLSYFDRSYLAAELMMTQSLGSRPRKFRERGRQSSNGLKNYDSMQKERLLVYQANWKSPLTPVCNERRVSLKENKRPNDESIRR